MLLTACGMTRAAVSGPADARSLGRHVLLIERAPDGQVTHAWRPIDGFEPAAHAHMAASREFKGRLVPVIFERDCEEERDACEVMCLASLQGRAWSHMTRGSKEEHCRARCRPAYLDCCRLEELAEGTSMEFHAVDDAIDWLKHNQEKVRVGAVVVITEIGRAHV